MMLEKIWYRLATATSTIPDFNDWQQTLIISILYGAIALPIGFKFGFTKFQPLADFSTYIKVMATSLVLPAISEELFFRVLLLPHPTENASQSNQFLWAAIGLIAFIIYHPLNGLTFFPAGLKTFTNPVFLGLATLLGIACTLSYFQTGSLWTSVAIHWLVVVVWLLLCGGYEKLRSSNEGSR
jgi:predicted Abi (CAAX) family protease